MLKYALIGQDIAPMLPSLLTDLLEAGHAAPDIYIEEKNSVMQDLLEGYTRRCMDRAGNGGTVHAVSSRRELLEGADCIVYAGDLMAQSRFDQDRQALMSPTEGETGLEDQARVNGGIGGLMHALRQGAQIIPLCEQIRDLAPSALVLCLAQPLSRCLEMFSALGIRAFGLGTSALRGPLGADALAAETGHKLEEVKVSWAGLPQFQFLLEMTDRKTGEDLMPRVRERMAAGSFGSMSRRWLQEYDAVCIGSATDHAQFMAAQEGYMPEEKPQLSETVEHRKTRILHMNTVAEKGLADPDGMISQLTLLTRTSPLRPGQLSLALMRKEALDMQGVTRRCGKLIRGLSPLAWAEAPLHLEKGQDTTPSLILPGPLLDLMNEIDEASRLAGQAALGDVTALREYIETDPALEGLDRLYVMDVVHAMIRMHDDILTQFEDEEE